MKWSQYAEMHLFVCREKNVSPRKVLFIFFDVVLEKTLAYKFICAEETVYRKCRSWFKKKQNF